MAKAASRWRALSSELTPIDDLFHWSAQCNIAHNERLFDVLVAALDRAGVSREEVARRLGIDVDTLEDALAGQTDLTLTELRLLSSASEVVIKFEVEAARDERVRMSQRALNEVTHAFYVLREGGKRSASWDDTGALVRAVHAKGVLT
ncbi:helix-turn-helix domain-containing protein [Microbacterium sp. As-52]|uniref:helix-turn-helix domain-containing protein n=1 Tax=Microbacterium sp. As-52 TaxID=3390503 RepID=UPI003CEC346A